MLRKILLLTLFPLFVSCSNDEASPDLIGTWTLAEVLADPGDGSGVFMPVESEKVIRFLANGDVISNQSLCSMIIGEDQEGAGFYSLEDSTIAPICSEYRLNTEISFRIEGANLILSYLCIEPCAEKYVKR